MKDFANKSALIGGTPKAHRPSAVPRAAAPARAEPLITKPQTPRTAAIPRTKPSAPRRTEPLFRLPPGLAQKYGKPVGLIVLGLLILTIAVRVAHRMEQSGSLHDKIESIKQSLSRHHPAEQTTTLNTTAATPKPAAKPTTNEPTFDFYTILPNRQGQASASTPAANSNSATQTASPATPTTRWSVATLPNQTAAEQLRAQLLLIGLAPTINNTGSGYRVVLTLPTAAALADAKRRIQQAGISGIQFQPA